MTLRMARDRRRSAIIAGAALLLFFTLLYGLTLDDGLRPGELEGGDLITHQYAQVQGRPSNAPGYPLYTMGGWLWYRAGRAVLGPDANPIRILSSYSTLWALASLALLYALTLELTDRGAGGNWLLAFLAAGFFGLTYFFWYYAVTTEQYTSSVAWTLAAFLLAFRWERYRRDPYLLALAFLFGVGLAHQLTVLLAAPPLLWFVLRTDPGPARRPRLALGTLVLAALPLLSYGFIYQAGARHPEWRGAGQWDSSASWFLSFISTRQGRDELTWTLNPLWTAEFPGLIVRELGWLGLAAGLAGLATIGRRRAAAVYATLAIYMLFCWVDRMGNWYQVIMPAYALLAAGIGAGADRLWELARARAGGRWLQRALLLGLVTLAASRGLSAYPRADSSGRPEDNGLDPGWAILADNPTEDARIFATQAEAAALHYLGTVWGARPDLQPVGAAEARGALARSQSLAATVAALPLAGSELGALRYSAWGPNLIGLATDASHSPPAAWAASRPRGPANSHDFGDGIRLADARAVPNPAANRWDVRLVWEAVRKPERDWSVSVRLGTGDADLALADAAHPVAGASPTSSWLPGEMVGDAYGLALTGDAAPDRLSVILYRRDATGEFENLDEARFLLR
jgi:hypothetical protein